MNILEHYNIQNELPKNKYCDFMSFELSALNRCDEAKFDSSIDDERTKETPNLCSPKTIHNTKIAGAVVKHLRRNHSLFLLSILINSY